MSDSISIRAYQDGDRVGVIDLLKSTFRFWQGRERVQSYWDWRCFDAPLGFDAEVAIVGDMVVGANLDPRLRVKIGPSAYLSYYEVAAATHPDFRGRAFSRS